MIGATFVAGAPLNYLGASTFILLSSTIPSYSPSGIMPRFVVRLKINEISGVKKFIT